MGNILQPNVQWRDDGRGGGPRFALLADDDIELGQNFAYGQIFRDGTLEESKGWARLPDDAFAHAFSFLSVSQLCTVAAVSRTWHASAYDPALWTRLDLSECYQIGMFGYIPVCVICSCA